MSEGWPNPGRSPNAETHPRRPSPETHLRGPPTYPLPGSPASGLSPDQPRPLPGEAPRAPRRPAPGADPPGCAFRDRVLATDFFQSHSEVGKQLDIHEELAERTQSTGKSAALFGAHSQRVGQSAAARTYIGRAPSTASWREAARPLAGAGFLMQMRRRRRLVPEGHVGRAAGDDNASNLPLLSGCY